VIVQQPPGSRSEPRACAYFDMDGTLLARSSISIYLRQLRAEGFTHRGDGLKLFGWNLLYRVGLLEAEQAFGWMGARLAGRREADLLEQGQRRFDQSLSHQLLPGVVELLQEHRRRGARVALLTASTSYLAQPLAQRLDIEPADLLCTRLQVQDGLFDGRLVTPICFGHGKVELARAHALRQGCDLSRSSFYTDSISDLPMLDEVGHPVAVNPDLRLGWLARRRGWPVLRFDLPG
jgi:putative phosphoserine phosphatase / 1-acylglycerol-3-phosphate O-acyltransferase